MTKAAKIVWFLCLAIFLGWLTHRAFGQTFQRSLPFLAKMVSQAAVPEVHDKIVHMMADGTNVLNIYGTNAANGDPVWMWRMESDAYTNTAQFVHAVCAPGENSSENYLSTVGPTGGPAVQFTTGDQLLSYGFCPGWTVYHPTNSFTIFMVLKCTNATSFQIFWYGLNNHPYLRADFTTGNNPGFSIIGPDGNDTVHAVPCNIWVLTNWTLVTAHIATNNCYVRTNGVNCGTVFDTAGGSQDLNQIVPISFQWQGYIAEIIAYDGAPMTTNALQTVENGLKTKYGL